MVITSQGRTTAALGGMFDARPARRQHTQRRPPRRRLLTQTWVLTARILHRWVRDPATLVESLIMPVVLLVTVNIVLGDGISQLTGHNALYGSVPLIAMVGAMSGAMIGGVSLMHERVDGFLTRLWALPMHRASGLLARVAAEAVRILATTVVILCAGMALGFRFRQGIPASLAWLLVPTVWGVAFTMIVMTLALYAANTIVVEATEVIWGLLMFFSSGFVPVDQYPTWLQPVVRNQPMSYTIEVMRGLSVGGPVMRPMIAVLLWSFGVAAVCATPMAIGYRRASMRS